MKSFTKKTFENLAAVHALHCISIFIPTHRTNKGGDGMKQDQINLKNQLKEASLQLSAFGLSDAEVDKEIKPIEDLLESTDFWLHLSDGLALFCAEGKLEHFTVPIDFEPFVYVSSHFYLKPMANLLRDTKECFLMKLSLNDLELYQVNSSEVFRITVSDLAPKEMTDTVGEDFEEKHLEGRVSNSRPDGQYNVYHGHGRSNDSVKKEEALRYFQQIDNGLKKLLNEQKLPLVIACVDYLYPIYSNANSYHFLEEQFIVGNPEHESVEDLAAEAMQIITKSYDEVLEAKQDRLQASFSKGEAAIDIHKVVPAAIGGRVDTLFVKANAEVWGTYEKETHEIKAAAARTVGDTDLLNLAVVETVKNGGEVHVITEDQMPDNATEIAATLRY